MDVSSKEGPSLAALHEGCDEIVKDGPAWRVPPGIGERRVMACHEHMLYLIIAVGSRECLRELSDLSAPLLFRHGLLVGIEEQQAQVPDIDFLWPGNGLWESSIELFGRTKPETSAIVVSSADMDVLAR
jgi:hypothetical protein